MLIMENEDYPLITIGLTTHNSESVIYRALTSIKDQQYPNYEIVIIDDYSQDSTLEILKTFASYDRRVRLMANSRNFGVSYGRNVITKVAKGDYIAFFDHDDYALPNRLTLQYQKLKEFEKQYGNAPAFCYCNALRIVGSKQYYIYGSGYQEPIPNGQAIAKYIAMRLNNERAVFTTKKLKDYPIFSNRIKEAMTLPELCDGYAFGEQGAGTLMASKSILTSLPFDENLALGEDWDLCIRLGEMGGYMVSVNELLILIYKQNTNAKEQQRDNMKTTLKEKYQHYNT